MTEKERKLREKIEKAQRLAERPGSEGEGKAAKNILKHLKKVLKQLRVENKKETEEQLRTYRVIFQKRVSVDLFYYLCNRFNVPAWSGRSKKGYLVKANAKKAQVELLTEIVELITPKYEQFEREAYKPVREAYQEYSKKVEAYRDKLINSDFGADVTHEKEMEEVYDLFEEENESYDDFDDLFN